jgi:hypothetical protein
LLEGMFTKVETVKDPKSVPGAADGTN